jgi:RNA polymerase sigma factor (sigma-70 family)
MASRQMAEVVHHLRNTVLTDDAGLTDAQLLANYLVRRDRAALEALVQRHGRMVWGVCRRTLDHHDAEDAFQATFLVLVRKAASIVPRAMVAGWLYGVARQTALKAKATLAKRKGREKQVMTMPEPAAMRREPHDDLVALLDEELSRLPDRYRAVIILCDLEGQTRTEAARCLGCPEGTVAGRLARARTMLAKRLARHGLAVSAVLSPDAASAVPASVVSATIDSATGHAVSANVVALTEGVLRIMLLKKLKIATAVLLAVGVLVSGGGLLIPSGEAGTPGENEVQRPADGQVPGKKVAERPDSPKVADVQVLFTGPPGMNVHVQAAQLELPARTNLEQGKLYRLKVSRIPNRPGVERFPTLEIPKARSETQRFIAASAIPVEFIDRDFNAVKDGAAITKVVFLERSGEPMTIASYDTPNGDVIEEAKRRGTILAVLRMGNIDLAGKLEAAGKLVEIQIGNDGVQGRVLATDKARADQMAKQLELMTRDAATVQAQNKELLQRLQRAELEIRSLRDLLAQKDQQPKVSVTFTHDKLPVNADTLGPLLRQMAWDRYHDERLTVRTTRPVETLTLIGPRESVEWAGGVIKALNAAR